MQISDAGLALIKREEKFMARPYRCSAGKLTTGYGHVIRANEPGLRTATLTEPEASQLLREDVSRTYGLAVARLLKRPATQNQFDAMVSLCFNIGDSGFAKSSVLSLFNAGAYTPAGMTAAFGLWNKITNPKTGQKEVARGLTLRRAREAAFFLQ